MLALIEVSWRLWHRIYTTQPKEASRTTSKPWVTGVPTSAPTIYPMYALNFYIHDLFLATLSKLYSGAAVPFRTP